jgi:bifunctional UDP-N-acetylglucosamine pyrophosphorylase/glucosamine-1-phosphate N-acetyltransferase
MGRLLIIPAAGRGSRLGASTPKLLTPVGGRSMLDRLLTLYSPVVERVALVVHPSARHAVLQELSGRASVDLFVQEQPTGMLDAILLARPAIEAARPARVWVTWCDQVTIHPRTIERLAEVESSDPLVALPTCASTLPYVHLDRDSSGRIVRVLHRREGDAMPDWGESDTGLFSVSQHAYLDLLPAFAADPGTGSTTGERNFLPFIPWAAQRGEIVTFACTEEAEALGVNTPEDLAAAERILRHRGGTAS